MSGSAEKGELGIYDFETIDDILDFDLERINIFAITTKIDGDFYVPKLKHVYFTPYHEIQVTYDIADDSFLYGTKTSARFTFTEPGVNENFSVSVGATYGSSFSENALNPDAYVNASIEFRTKHSLGLQMGKYHFTASPSFKMRYYLNGLTMESPSGSTFDIVDRYEIGVKFGTDPRMKIWKLKIPRIRVTYDFSEDFSGVKIKFGG